MWPSEDWASKIYDVANWFLIGALIIGAASTVLVVWMGNVKEAYLRRELAITTDRAAHAEERAGKLEKDAAELRKTAEDERLARIKIEASVGWRRLTEKQKTEIGTNLRRFSNQGVSFWSNAGDVEAQLFAADIAEAVTRAGTLRVYAPAQMLKMMEGGAANLGKPIKRIDIGVVVVYTDDAPSHELADTISLLLVDCGFDAISRKNEPPPQPIAPQVWVNVESRPQGAQGEYKLKAHKTAHQ
jgi:hypothetical protein